MSIMVNRDFAGVREFVGEITYDAAGRGKFVYDSQFVDKARKNGELGVSELLPLGTQEFSREEFNPFFSGLMPEGEVMGDLTRYYQVPQSNYLAMLEQMGCESIGALTFVSSSADINDYIPYYKPVDSGVLAGLSNDPVRGAANVASTTRLSLAGAQSKVAWFLPLDAEEETADADWQIPFGTAPSSHIIKISRRGEEDIALNELACSLLAKSCGIETANVTTFDEVPGVIAVRRYDRIWTKIDGVTKLLRLHQEDFCQALGLPPYLKYQPSGVECDYPHMMAELVRSTCENPQEDLQELVKRILFCYAIGNSDAHLKNFSLLYNRQWTARGLSPLYDVTCIPLTGYSTVMPFNFGEHRNLEEITAEDITLLAINMDIPLDTFDKQIEVILPAFEAPRISGLNKETMKMVGRILENAKSRLEVLRKFMTLSD